MEFKNKHLTAITLVVWVILLGVGWTLLSRYENTPSVVNSLPQYWPKSSQISRAAGLSTLMMFIHPHCPCTTATMSELALIMAHGRQKVRAHVVFVRLKGFSFDWVKTDLWKNAKRIPGVEVMIDDFGKEAHLFHASVSGQVMLYDSQGKLIFNGGITAARGHEGDNDGQEAIINFLTQGVIPIHQTPVYGCAVFNKYQERF